MGKKEGVDNVNTRDFGLGCTGMDSAGLRRFSGERRIFKG
jgi:hypothetical protein